MFVVYSNAIQENVNTLLYSGFTEELVDILELKTEKLMVRCYLMRLELIQNCHTFHKRTQSTGGGQWPPYSFKKMSIMMHCIFIHGN